MIFEIAKEPSFEELQNVISNQFPDYPLKMNGKHFLIVKKSASCGVNIVMRKGKMYVNGNFPSLGGRLLFTFTFLLLGIIIPLIIYFATFHKKFKAMEAEIGGYLKDYYSVG